jgi:hypothetical protein
MPNESGSRALMLNGTDVSKVVKGLVIALAGAGITYGTEQIPGIDFGVWTPIVAAGWATVVNLLRKWIADQSQ